MQARGKGSERMYAKRFHIKMTTHQNIELGFVQIIDVHVNV